MFNFFNKPNKTKEESVKPLSSEKQQEFWNKNTSPDHEEFKKEIIGENKEEPKGNFLKSERENSEKN